MLRATCDEQRFCADELHRCSIGKGPSVTPCTPPTGMARTRPMQWLARLRSYPASVAPSRATLRRVKAFRAECPDHFAVLTSNPDSRPSQRIGPSGLLVDYTPVAGARGVVAFGHAGGSGRSSPRNRLVAGVLHDYGLSTLMVDLLPDSAQAVDPRIFDIALLAGRIVEAMDWLRAREPAHGARVALLGIGTCGAAALRVAAQWPQRTTAVVMRGGRPDLAADFLSALQVPTLMIVGGNDADAVALNRRAAQAMRGEHRLDVLPGSSQRFEEPGALEAVAHLAGAWFARHSAVVSPARATARSA